MEKSIKIYSEDPLVKTESLFLSEEECEHFINISKDSLKPALVSNATEGVISSGRTGYNTWIEHDHDEITHEVGKRIAKCIGLPLENAEKYQIIYYDKNQEYRQHYDSWVHDNSEKTLRCMKYGGSRLRTALCYLNDVSKGGGTKMTKLDITIPAEKGKLLVFQNTVSIDDHRRHELSEHAGLPVEEGEKYAFNLWFKECNSKMLYKDHNPDYYKTKEETTKENKKVEIPNIFENMEISEILHKNIHKISDFVSKETCTKIIKQSKFNTKPRRDAWLKLGNVDDLTSKIEKNIGINREFYENLNVVEYLEHKVHEKHHNAYDITTEHGKKYTATLGQRIYTITLFLSDNFNISFPLLKQSYNFDCGDMLVYANVKGSNRDNQMQRSILSLSGTGYIANIYVREKTRSGKSLLIENANTNVNLQISEVENYTDTLNKVFMAFKNDSVSKIWRGIDSFKYNFKGDFESFKKYIKKYDDIRSSGNILTQDNLETNYSLDKKLPIQIVNNVLNSELLVLLKEYYKETIENKVWPLGDRQSNRYKAHDEPMSRFLHYEILPLIEKIVGKSMRPTYTYLSAYVKGADLPPHTDRPDCEYTVSFIVDKPEGSNWNIHVHKPQQKVKHKGRYDEKPPLEECEAVDCDAGGLMLFQGTDHIHFREELEHDYYNVLLLHYCSV